jgi:hypothetical protein
VQSWFFQSPVVQKVILPMECGGSWDLAFAYIPILWVSLPPWHYPKYLDSVGVENIPSTNPKRPVGAVEEHVAGVAERERRAAGEEKAEQEVFEASVAEREKEGEF